MPGFISGFMSVGIHNAIQKIFYSANTAVRCREELASLKDLIMKMEPIIKEIQQNRLELNRKKDMKPSAVNAWLEQLDALLQQASKMVDRCTIPTCDIVSRYQMRIMITRLISDINEHLKLSPLVHMAQTQEVLADALGQMRQTVEAPMDSVSTSSASTSLQSVHSSTGITARKKLIDEPLIVGQDQAIANLHKLVMEDEDQARNIGVLGKGGSGKTLLLKTVFNSQKVRSHFSDGLLLWLTVSQSPSVTTLRTELYTQITLQKIVDLGKNMKEEDIQIWLNETLQQSRRLALFLDDVWDRNAAELLEDLGIQLPVTVDSKVIVSSRSRTALQKMGIGDKYTIVMEDLMEEDSWKLFAGHAFPYNHMKPPGNMDVEKAKLVCHKCGGLPLAIKVVGKAMAGSIDPRQWEWAAQLLPEADSVYDCLRLSYDALGKEDFYLQLCFLYVAAAFLEDKIISVYEVIQRWVGEGLLARKMLQDHNQLQLGYDQFEMGKIYLNLLADRCLVEPIMRGVDGQVEYFRVHDVIHDLGIRIAEEEEHFYCRVGCNLATLNQNECSSRTRILLSDNHLTALPESWRAPQVCSLLLPGNIHLTKVPSTVIRSMISLKFLDLSGTSVQSLPKSVGDLKQLVCLALIAMPAIKKLPRSVTNLVRLEILDVSFSAIRALPSGLHKLTSLRYLDITCCKDLQYLPASISRLTSLQYLLMYGCTTLWRKDQHKRFKRVASINNVATLRQLKMLSLTNNGDIISEGTLGNMVQMDSVQISLTNMESLPFDMSNMLKLRRLVLECSHLVKLESNFCNFQNMSNLELSDCGRLEELSYLHKLKSLRQLRILRCSKLRKFPQEFGEIGAFPLLEIFSLLGLDNLEELPKIEDGAMISLKLFTLMECPALRILPPSFLKLKTLEKIRIYGCSMVAENLKEVKGENTMVRVMTMSIQDTIEVKIKYLQVKGHMTGWLYGEFWCNELFLFLKGLEAF